MKRTKHIACWIVAAVAVLVGLAFGWRYVVLDWQGRPFCHKQVMLALLNGMHPSGGDITKDPQPFPNVKGVGRDSLATISDGMGGFMAWAGDYGYVPGLREGDPPDLVLMYFNRPTRWKWHGVVPTIFEEKAWIIIPVDFGSGLEDRSATRQVGECCERLPQDAFCERLRRTLEFIRSNERPHWQTIVAEQEKFLDSVEHGNR